ncbi:MAG: pentapeptide repeat-containing protein [Rhodobacteraceae bacterium]|nr:pentapeptide repeat-containing protein [Paracoccaceae bacterium]
MPMILIVFGGAFALVFLVFITWIFLKPRWMGFADKTLWDWMKVFAMPVMISFGVGGIGLLQQEIERGRTEEQAVQQYIDRISLAYSSESLDQTSLAVTRAQTTGVLRLVSGERASRVLAFLNDLGVLETIVPKMEFLDLYGAEMKGLALSGFDFEGSDLRWVEFEETILTDADFEETDLRHADMKDADLRGADFEYARMNGVDLDHADLRGADLALALGLNDKQLSVACLDETTLLPPEIDEPSFNGPGCFGKAEND